MRHAHTSIPEKQSMPAKDYRVSELDSVRLSWNVLVLDVLATFNIF